MIILRVLGAGITGGLAVYVARMYGAEFSGHFFLFLSSISIISVLTRLGADPYLTAHVAPLAHTGRLAGSSFFASTLTAVAVLLSMASILVVGLTLFFDTAIRRAFADTPIFLVIGATAAVNLVWLTGAYSRAIGWANMSVLLETSLLYLWLFILLEAFRATRIDLSITNIAVGICFLMPLLLSVLTAVFWTERGSMFTASGAVSAMKGVGSFGAVIVTNGIIMVIPLQALGLQGLTEDAGVYNAALRVSMFVGAFGLVIKSAIVRTEALSSNDGTTDRSGDFRSASTILGVLAGFSLIVAWQGGTLASLFGSEFSEIRSFILIMLLAQCITVAGSVFETRAVLDKARRVLNQTAAMTLAVALIAAPLLVHGYGLTGAAWAFAVTACSSRITLLWLYLRRDRLTPRP